MWSLGESVIFYPFSMANNARRNFSFPVSSFPHKAFVCYLPSYRAPQFLHKLSAFLTLLNVKSSTLTGSVLSPLGTCGSASFTKLKQGTIKPEIMLILLQRSTHKIQHLQRIYNWQSLLQKLIEKDPLYIWLIHKLSSISIEISLNSRCRVKLLSIFSQFFFVRDAFTNLNSSL